MAAPKPVITKKTLADDLAKKYGMTKKDANAAVGDIFDTITDALKKGGEVSINGFGKFVVVKTKARMGLNPATGEKIKVKASRSPRFKASKTLKDTIK
ncbi:MAG: HU family DNA-binding protein [Solobacterium sp.]|nr:HU family DNA-binding protein [Solobacterium sp.]